jgi:ribosomal protein S18 acetylase RimI-like enzyme
VRAIVALVDSAYRGEESRKGWTTEADLLDGQRTDAQEIEEILDDPEARMTLAIAGADIVGTVLSRREHDTVHIGMLAVRPTLQRSGIGRRLLEEAERLGRAELGCRQASMHVIESRPELIAWYVSRGYRDTGEREPFPYGDSRFGQPKVADLRFVVLQKRLA